MPSDDATTYLGGIAVQRAGKVVLIGMAVAAAGAAALAGDHVRTPFDADFEAVGNKRMVDSDLLRALARVESNMDPYAVSKLNPNGTRDYGLMQVNESTATRYGVSAPDLVGAPRDSIDLAARVLLDMRRELADSYSLPTLISAYNQGVAGVLKRGISNSIYVAAVQYHHVLYSLGRLFR